MTKNTPKNIFFVPQCFVLFRKVCIGAVHIIAPRFLTSDNNYCHNHLYKLSDLAQMQVWTHFFVPLTRTLHLIYMAIRGRESVHLSLHCFQPRQVKWQSCQNEITNSYIISTGLQSVFLHFLIINSFALDYDIDQTLTLEMK